MNLKDILKSYIMIMDQKKDGYLLAMLWIVKVFWASKYHSLKPKGFDHKASYYLT